MSACELIFVLHSNNVFVFLCKQHNVNNPQNNHKTKEAKNNRKLKTGKHNIKVEAAEQISRRKTRRIRSGEDEGAE